MSKFRALAGDASCIVQNAPLRCLSRGRGPAVIAGQCYAPYHNSIIFRNGAGRTALGKLVGPSGRPANKAECDNESATMSSVEGAILRRNRIGGSARSGRLPRRRYSGDCPWFGGAVSYQVNVQIPPSVQPGNAVPFIIQMGDVVSNTAYIAVQAAQ